MRNGLTQPNKNLHDQRQVVKSTQRLLHTHRPWLQAFGKVKIFSNLSIFQKTYSSNIQGGIHTL